MRMIPRVALTLAVMLAPIGAVAKSGLEQEKEVNDRLLVISVGDKINRACDSISVRRIKAWSYANDTKDLAKSLGYSSAEIDSYTNDKANRAEMRERRNLYFKARGASNLDPQSLCVLGRAEIQKQSQIGVLLKAR